MVVYAQVKELVNDDHLLKDAILSEEIFTETDASAGRARSPFLCHVLDLDAQRPHADPGGPPAHLILQYSSSGGSPALGFHHLR